MLAGGYLAIGPCPMALTRNQVIAFVISVVACSVHRVGCALGVGIVSSRAPQALVETLASFSLLTHFRAITGVIDARDVVFFVSLIGVFLTATIVVVDMKKGEGLVYAKRDEKAPCRCTCSTDFDFVSLNLFSNIVLCTARLDLTGTICLR